MNIKLVDTHCHIQFDDYKLDAETVWQEAKHAGVDKIFVVGCDLESSKRAVEFARHKSDVYAIVGVHPHEANKFLEKQSNLNELENLLNNHKKDKIIAVGEFGLDYFYKHSPKSEQIKLLEL